MEDLKKIILANEVSRTCPKCGKKFIVPYLSREELFVAPNGEIVAYDKGKEKALAKLEEIISRCPNHSFH